MPAPRPQPLPPPSPPRKNLAFLIVSSVLVAAWLAFLAWMAMRS